MTGTLNMFLWYTRCYHAISLLVVVHGLCSKIEAFFFTKRHRLSGPRGQLDEKSSNFCPKANLSLLGFFLLNLFLIRSI